MLAYGLSQGDMCLQLDSKPRKCNNLHWYKSWKRHVTS